MLLKRKKENKLKSQQKKQERKLKLKQKKQESKLQLNKNAKGSEMRRHNAKLNQGKKNKSCLRTLPS